MIQTVSCGHDTYTNAPCQVLRTKQLKLKMETKLKLRFEKISQRSLERSEQVAGTTNLEYWLLACACKLHIVLSVVGSFWFIFAAVAPQCAHLQGGNDSRNPFAMCHDEFQCSRGGSLEG